MRKLLALFTFATLFVSGAAAAGESPRAALHQCTTVITTVATVTTTAISTVISTVTTTVTTPTTTTTPTTACNLYASSGGSDSNPGSLTSPFRSVVKLDGSLAPGQTGCLRGGSYGSSGTWHDLTGNGTATGRITITSYPGEVATIQGAVQVDGAYTTLTGLKFDGSNTFYSGSECSPPGRSLSAIAIGASNTIIDHNEIYDSSTSLPGGNAIYIGGGGQPANTIIRYNKIHDYGSCYHFDHAIYLGAGNNTQVYGNWIWNGRYGQGIQLYPNPTNARVYGNVVDTSCAGFDIDGTSTGNQVFHNVVANATGCLYTPAQGGGTICGVAITPSGPVAGSLNRFDNNDAWHDPCGVGSVANVEMSGNISADPLFVNAATHDYRVQAGSPVASWGLWDGN